MSKYRIGLLAVFVSAAALSGAIDIYNAYSLPDLGLGSRSRHIQSWNRNLAASVGEVTMPNGRMRASVWPEITNTGGGTLTLLQVPNEEGNSSAASYTRLTDGRYLIIGKWTDLGGSTRAAAWINTTIMPWNYMGFELPDVPVSTGTEALDISSLPGGSAIIVGSRWPNVMNHIRWDACFWFVNPNGQVVQTVLPVPDGTGWSRAYSSTLDPNNPNVVVMVGQIQETPDGDWRACMWRVNLNNGNMVFKYIDTGTTAGFTESYGYRVDPQARFAMGWMENENGDFGTVWRLKPGFPNITLDFNSRIYGTDSSGYVVGWQERTPGDRRGLFSHVSYLQDRVFSFVDLLDDRGTFTDYFHLLCRAEDGQTTGCATSTDYPAGSSLMHAIVAVPTDVFAADEIDVRHGQLQSGDEADVFTKDARSMVIRAQGRRVVADASIMMPPDNGGLELYVDLDITGDNVVNLSIDAYNFNTKQYEPTGESFTLIELMSRAELEWATFPSSWRSATGEVRFRLRFQTDDRRDFVSINAMRAERM